MRKFKSYTEKGQQFKANPTHKTTNLNTQITSINKYPYLFSRSTNIRKPETRQQQQQPLFYNNVLVLFCESYRPQKLPKYTSEMLQNITMYSHGSKKIE